MHTAEIKVLVEPELKTQVNQARGLVSLSAWVRDAIEMKLKLCPDRDWKHRQADAAQQVIEEYLRHRAIKEGVTYSPLNPPLVNKL